MILQKNNLNLSVERGRKGAATYHPVWALANVPATRSTSRHYLLCTGPIFVLRFMCSSHTPVSKPLVYLRTFRFIALIVLCESDFSVNIYGIAKQFFIVVVLVNILFGGNNY